MPGHEGLDIRAPYGAAFKAIADGTVYWTGYGTAYGYHVIINHVGGVQTIYAHARSDIPVRAGQTVKAGDVVAYSGNTGNSTGAHLHLTLKIPGHVETGWECCPTYGDPLPHLLPVAPLPPPTTEGWVYAPYLTPGLNGRHVNVTPVNVRTGPSTAYTRLGTAYFGSVFVNLGESRNNYVKVRVSNINLYNMPDTPVGNARIGPHFSADSRFLPGEAEAAIAMKPGIMKFLSSHRPEDVSWAASTFPGVPIVIRPFLDWGGRNITPQQFFDWTWSDVQRTINAIGSGRTIILELPGNEANLKPEGWTYSWNNGREYADWGIQVVNLYRQVTTNPIYYPGLSPGGNVANLRIDHIEFFEQSRELYNICDGLCVHAYFNPPGGFPLSSAIAVVDNYISRAGKTIIVSEFSWNANSGTPQQKGTAYLDFLYAMRQRPIVYGITPFVMSASNPAWSWATGTGEVFVENGASVGIAEVIGSR